MIQCSHKRWTGFNTRLVRDIKQWIWIIIWHKKCWAFVSTDVWQNINLTSIYKFKKVTWLPSFVVEFLRSWRPSDHVEFLRGDRPPDSFSSLWAAFTLTVHINALYNESKHGKEEHATWINMIPLKYCIYSGFLCRTDVVNATRSSVYAWIVVTA